MKKEKSKSLVCLLCVQATDHLSDYALAFFTFIFSLFFCMACTSGPLSLLFVKNVPASFSVENVPADTDPVSFFSSLPDKNGLVFIGSTGRRSNPKDTLRFALEDAARQVAVFYKVSGEFTIVNNIGSGAFDYVNDTYTSLDYDIEGAKKFVDSLSFNADTDTLETENTFFVRTIYGSTLPFPLSYSPIHRTDQKPDWVDNPPLEIEGYEVGVGYSGRYSSLSDTYKNSSRNAVFDIIRRINTISESNDMLYRNTGSLFGYKTSNNNIVRSYGTLAGFYVLDTWMDPHEKSVWTLAIAVKP